jgi:GntR family transcriptional repressor for pyruvate dehydrogenase complex
MERRENVVKIEKNSLSDVVTKTIIRYINQGKYVPGEKLPSNEELAQMLNVGRSSVREALKELQTLGLVILKHGEGTYVSSFTPSKEGPTLLEKITEVRRMIEVYCVKIAAESCDSEVLEFIKDMYNGMVENINYETEFTYFDRKFHYGIAKSTNNSFIVNMYSSIETLFAELQFSIVYLKGSKEKAIRDHEAILKAILSKDSASAVEATNKHLDSVVEQILENYKQGKAENDQNNE